MINKLFNWPELEYKIKCFFKPRQEWLTDVIPDTYCDKAELIPKLLFKCLEHYVEEDTKAGDLDYDWLEEVKEGHVTQEHADEQVKQNNDILRAYKWITMESAELDKQIDNALNDILTQTEYGCDQEACYDTVVRLERVKAERTNESLQTIIKYHHKLS